MNRSDLQKLARLRVKEAKVLLDNRYFEGAYYLARYAVECALKACIAKGVKRYEFPDRKVVQDSYTHDLEKLLSVSGLRAEFNREAAINPEFKVRWAVVKDWSEEARYLSTVDEKLARDFYSAVTARRSGVLTWLKKWW